MAFNESSDNSRTAVTKKPYEKPSFRFEQVFVTSALTCGKTPGSTDLACHSNPKAS
jgi:hypothetical protein